MKTTRLSIKLFLLLLFFLTAAISSRAQGSLEVHLPFDYIELPGDEIDPSGDVWVCRVLSNQGVSRSAIESALSTALDDPDISAIITSIELTEWKQNMEGELSITFSPNTSGEERGVTLVCGVNEYPLTQDCLGSPVYTLTVNKSVVAKGERIVLTLSGSVDYAKYAIYKDGLQDGSPEIGTGGAMTFIAEGEGVYTCRSVEPTETQMNGICTVSLYPFYGSTHSSSNTTINYSLSPDGETITVPFVPNPNNPVTLSQLSNILSSYSSGSCSVWTSTMKISYNSTLQVLSVTAAPNLSNTDIVNNTYFKTNSSSTTLVFTQSVGGHLLSFPCHYSIDSQTGSGSLVLEGSQYLVGYYLSRDGVAVGDTVVGTGGAISLPLPQSSGSSPRGKYSITATSQGHTLTLGGIYITTTGKLLDNSNFIAKEHYLTSASDSSYIDVTYYDGLGYPRQTINVLGTPNKNHFVQPVVYDALRRVDAKSYLPFATSSTGQNPSVLTPVASPLSSQQSFYASYYGSSDAQYAYAEKIYGSSPAGRVKEQIVQGQAYRQGGRSGANTSDITQKNTYLSNSPADVLNLQVVNISGTEANKITVNGFLPSRTLYKNRVTTPDSTVTEQFVLSDGRVLLSQTYSLISGSTDTLRTYYVYDKNLRQRYVITPNGSKVILETLRTNSLQSLTIGNAVTDNINLDAFKDLYCYCYDYDGRDQVIEKKLPGSSFLTILYDRGGRAVASQDSLLRMKSQWKFSQYDRSGRTIAQYLLYAPDKQSLKSWISDSTHAGLVYNYNNQNRNILLSAFRYDSEPSSTSLGTAVYNALSLQSLTGVVTTSDTCSRTRSLLTFDKVLDLGTLEAYEQSVEQGSADPSLLRYRLSRYYYDSLARVVQKVTLYPDGERTVSSTKYGFTGNILKNVQELTSTGINSNGASNSITFSPATIIETISYDHRLRPVKTVSAACIATASNALNGTVQCRKDSLLYTYDELGRLLSTSLSTSTITTLTSSFNIQNWLTDMTLTRANNPLYAQVLRYYSPTKGAKPLFGGNISEWEVNQATVNVHGVYSGQYDTQNYLFTYDGLGRLKESKRLLANSLTDVTSYTEKGLTYDINGNVLTLNRYGASATVPEDNLSYTYAGDKLTTLSNGNNNYTFTYDANGNTIQDGLRNITLLYSQLNTLTKIINSSNTVQAQYSFFADGAKYEVRDGQNNGRRYLGTFSQSITANSGSSSSYTLSTDEISSSSPLLAFHLSSGSGIPVGPDPLAMNVSGTFPSRGEKIFNPEYIPLWRIADHLGSVRLLLDKDACVLEQNDYYPYGLRTNSGRSYKESTAFNRLKYNGKEQQAAIVGVNYIDYGARFYDPVIIRWTTQDPMAEKYTSYSPYNYCINNPVSIVDPNGLDTLNISFANGKWIFNTPILASGDDVFNISVNGKTQTITFSEGEYGLRVEAINLENTENYTLGIYHISGAEDGGTGYFVTPGGEVSKKTGDNKRIAEGIYPMTTPSGYEKWRTAGVGGSVENRGVKFHYAGMGIIKNHWTGGCFVISNDYSLSKDGKDVNFKGSESLIAYKAFNKLLGAQDFFQYSYINPKGKKINRIGADFKNNTVKHTFILKTIVNH